MHSISQQFGWELLATDVTKTNMIVFFSEEC